MHELPVRMSNAESGKVLTNGREVVYPSERTLGAIGAGVHESFHAEVVPQPLTLRIAQMGAEKTPPDVSPYGPRNEDRPSPHNAYRHEIVEGLPGIEHGHQATPRPEYTSDLRLRRDDVRNVVQNAVRKDQIEALVREGDFRSRSLHDPLVGQIVQLQPKRNSPHGFGRQVDAVPACAPANQLFRFRTLPEADLQHPLAPYLEIIEALGDVAFQLIAVGVVRIEEGRVVAAKSIVQAPQQAVTTGMRLPEILYLSLGDIARHRRQDLARLWDPAGPTSVSSAALTRTFGNHTEGENEHDLRDTPGMSRAVSQVVMGLRRPTDHPGH